MWLSWLEHYSAHRKVAGSIPRDGIHLGYGFIPNWGTYWKQLISVSHIDVSLSLLSLPSSLSKINENMSSGED